MPAIAINGLGHNGRAALKILQGVDGVSIAAVNDLAPPDEPAYLLEHDLLGNELLGNDSVHGRWSKPVESEGDALVVDAAMTRVVDGTLVRVLSWYDNEWGFTHQMLREALSLLGVDHAL